MNRRQSTTRTALPAATLSVVTAAVLTAAGLLAPAAAAGASMPAAAHASVATAPAGSPLRQPFVAAATRQAALPHQAPTARWTRAARPVPVCGAPAPGDSTCLAIARATGASFPAAADVPAANSPSDPDFTGYQPADIQAAYDTATLTAAPLVAIVDAFDDPGAETDLTQYRSTFNLPACTTADGCFTKVDQTGGTDYPPANQDWLGEISLDLDAVSAVCPTCHILLVEANSDSSNDLYQGAVEAATLGAKYVSMSWGSSEGSLVDALGADDAAALARSTDRTVFATPGVSYVASTGDDAFRYDADTEPLGGLDYPASSPNVVAAGGVTLNRDATTGAFSTTAWSWDPSTQGCMYASPFSETNRCSGAGSGCSSLEPAQPWQQSSAALAAVCPGGRAGADVSADADPDTGLLVDVGGTGEEIGGTSLAAPLLTSLYALSGETTGSVSGAVQSRAYADPSGLVDVTAGVTGSCGNALCTSGAGWDGPTGLGSPDSPGVLIGNAAPVKARPAVRATWPAFRFGTAATVRVSVSATVAPSGTVTLRSGSTVLASGMLAGTGGTTRTVGLSVSRTALAPGSHALTVSYSGDTDVAAATAAAHPVSVAKAAPTVTATWPAFRYGAAARVTVAVRATVAPAGTLVLKWGAKRLARAQLPAGGTTAKRVSLAVHTGTLTAGRRALSVEYSGDADVAARTLAAHAVTVGRATSTVTAHWPARIRFAAPFSVKVSVKASGTPAGMVKLKMRARLIKAVRLPAGAATTKKIVIRIAARKLARGMHKLTLSYSGDANVAARRLRPHAVRVV